MPFKILKTDIYRAAEHLNNITNHSQAYGIGRGRNGGWVLVRHGDWYISPVLPKRELYEWIWAYLYGIRDGQKILTTK